MIEDSLPASISYMQDTRLILIGNFVEQDTTQCKQNRHYHASVFSNALGKWVLGYKDTIVFYRCDIYFSCSVEMPASHTRELFLLS